MLATAIAIETNTDSKALPYSCQVKSKADLDPSKIFARILEALEAKNAPDIARKMGLTKQSVYDWQKITPSVDKLLWISQTSNTSLDWLLTGAGEKELDASRSVSFDEMLSGKIRDIVREEIAASRKRLVHTLDLTEDARKTRKAG